MTDESFDCVEMKRQIQEELRRTGSRKPLDKWNESVIAQLRKDPHLQRFSDQLRKEETKGSRQVG